MHKKGLQKSNRRLILFEVLKKNPKWFLTNPQTTILAMYWGAAYSNQLMHSLERKSTLCPSPPPIQLCIYSQLKVFAQNHLERHVPK